MAAIRANRAPVAPSAPRAPTTTTTSSSTNKRAAVNIFTGREKRALVQLPLPAQDAARPHDADAVLTLEYPVNMARRDYQYSIVRKAVLRNTLVILPTSCGKTFIAAVVMANFFRWFPASKVVFLAPTRPLIAQQFEACYSIMGVPHAEMAFMTGTVNRGAREALWRSRRLLFMTPQVLNNDIAKGVVDARSISLVVVDEAHRARGHHAYCTALRDIRATTCHFRVLALSATPGATVRDVQEVLDNLFIAHIEIRQEHDIDVRQYMQKRVLEVQVVPSSVLIESLEQQLLAVMQLPVDQLRGMGALPAGADTRTLTTTAVKLAQNAFRNRSAPAAGGARSGPSLHAEGLFGLLAALVAAGKTLGTHGPGMFANQLDKLVNAEQQSRTKRALYETAQFRSMHIAAKRVAADPRANAKVNAMLGVVSAHFAAFAAAQSSTRVIVFTQWRDSVYEVVRQLGERGGDIRPVAFVGQSDARQGLTTVKGLNQREQSRIVRQFRDGELNVLVSTCIGEEGLDIGEVDLIVCFDVSSDSRALVQRMGRTGRKRNGRCVILCTDAERILYERNVHANHQIAETIVRRQSEAFKRYEHNERMLPAPPTVVERRFEPMPAIAAAASPSAKMARAPRARARRTAADADDVAGAAAVAEMVQRAGGDLPRWRVKHAFLYNPLEALRLANSRAAHSSASLTLQRVGELTDVDVDDLSDLANSLTAAAVGSRRALACDRRRLAIARIEAEESDELLRSWDHCVSAPAHAAASTADEPCATLSLSDDDDDDDDDGVAAFAELGAGQMSFSDDDGSVDLFGGGDEPRAVEEEVVVLPPPSPPRTVVSVLPSPIRAQQVAAAAQLLVPLFDPRVLPPPLFPPLSPPADDAINASASSVAAAPLHVGPAHSFVPLSPPPARTPRPKSGVSVVATPYSSQAVRVRRRVDRVLESQRPTTAQPVVANSASSTERSPIRRKRLRKRRASTSSADSTQPRALQPIPNRVKVVGAKSSKQAIARYRLLDLDADDDDDDDTDDDTDDDAGGDDTDMASFVARDDDEIDVDRNGSHPGILGLGLYRRAMLSSSQSSLSAATAVSGGTVVGDSEFEDATL